MTSNTMANIDEIKQRIGATQIELSKYVKIEPIEKEDRKGWVNYGEGNAFPQYLIELYNESPIHGALVNSISYMIAGRELTASTPQAVKEISRLNLDSIIHPTSLDLKLQGGFYWEIIWSMDRSTIAQVNHLPFENCRLACSDEEDDVVGVWYSRDWTDMRKKKNTPHFIPMFDVNTNEAEPKQVLFVHSLMVGSEYYPKPDYVGAINEIEKMRQLSEYQVNLILNGFFPSLIASFNNGIPSLEEQHIIKNQLQMSIQGSENAGKVLTFFNEERDRGVEFTPFPVSDMDKQFTTLVDQSMEAILVSHRVTSPLLFGVRAGGGLGSNTDEMQTAMRIFQRQVIEPFQRLITSAVEEVLASFGVFANVKIVQNDLFADDTVVDASGEVAQPVDVASQAMNGAQISSLLEIITQATANVLTIPSAKAVCKTAFPTMTDVQINNIFDNLSSVAIDPTQVVQKKKVDLESYAPTDDMAGEAELGLKWREEYGRGGTEVGVARARDISNKRNLSFDTVQRMNSYFSRHEVDKEATGWNQGEEGFPTAGRIAWQLWGGDAGRDWAKRIIERVNENQSTHVCQSSNDFTDEEGRIFIDELKSKAEYIDIEEWELISEEDVLDPENELNYTSQLFNKMPSMNDANGGDKSQWGDAGLYKLRYAYSQNLSVNSREFCVEMVGLSVAGAVFRYEDIKRMSDKGVNGDFAPTGQSTYDIFTYKGGSFCHHFFKRQIYMRKRDSKGRILPNEGLENDKRVGNNPFVPKKGVEGVAPINTPSRGSIKYA
jgi:hypothetical protein